MVGFIKGFKDLIPLQIQRVILAVIGVAFLIFELDGNTDDFLLLLMVLLPIVLILATVALLEMKNQHLGALLVLLISIFADDIQVFVSALGSYDFFFKDFDDITVRMIIGFIVALYVLLLVMSYALTEKISFKFDLKSLFFPIFIASIWMYMCYGFSTAFPMFVTAMIAFGLGCTMGGLFILLAMPIIYPIMILNFIVNDAAELLSIYEWLIGAASIYVIYLLVINILPLIKKQKQIEG
jgi:hypothetical protein